MVKAEWGVKRLCPKCSTRFYDLNQDPATCPNCEHSFEIASLFQSDMRAKVVKEASKSNKVDAEDIIEDDVDLIDDDPALDDELLEDDDTDTVSIEEIADVPADQEE